MPSVKLKDLVEIFQEYMLKNFNILPRTEKVGLFPGEKEFEELMTEKESKNAVELPEMFVILPHIEELIEFFPNDVLERKGQLNSHFYDSSKTTPLRKEELKKLLDKHGVFEFMERYV